MLNAATQNRTPKIRLNHAARRGAIGLLTVLGCVPLSIGCAQAQQAPAPKAAAPKAQVLRSPSTFPDNVTTTRQPLTATAVKVDESKVQKTYFVAPGGNDGAAGTTAQPFGTLNHAAKAALADKAKNIGVKIVLAPGIYRQSARIVALKGTPDTAAPLVIEAAQKGTAVISGADIWTGWRRTGDNWTHAWRYAWGLGPANTPSGKGPTFPTLMRRREMIVVDGQLMRQVLAANELAPGTFLVDETAKVVTLRPAAGTDMSRAVVEVAVRDKGLAIDGLQNVVLRGVVVRHVGGVINDAAVLSIGNCSNVLLEDCDAVWNNFRGLGGQRIRNLTMRRVRASNNGQIGMQFGRVNNVLAEDCDTSGNSWRGHWAGFYPGWSPCGFKLRYAHISTWRRHRAVNNFSRGMWWDGDCSHIIVEDSVTSGNLMSGMFIESSPGPARVSRSIFANTRYSPTGRREGTHPGALSTSTTPDVTLENNILWNNEVPQFRVWSLISRDDNIDFETGENYGLKARALRYTLRGNVFVASGDQRLFSLPLVGKSFAVPTGGVPRVGKVEDEPFDFFYKTLTSDRNVFWHPQDRKAFQLQETMRDLEGWREFTGQDRNSLWADPGFADAANFDFGLKPGSPLTVNLPTGLAPGMAKPPSLEPLNLTYRRADTNQRGKKEPVEAE